MFLAILNPVKIRGNYCGESLPMSDALDMTRSETARTADWWELEMGMGLLVEGKSTVL